MADCEGYECYGANLVSKSTAAGYIYVTQAI